MLKTRRFPRQKRKIIAALVAAAGSFAIGIFLPIDMWANSAKSVNKSAVEMSKANAIDDSQKNLNVLQEIVKIKPVVDKKVKGSKNALETLELQRFNFAIPKRF